MRFACVDESTQSPVKALQAAMNVLVAGHAHGGLCSNGSLKFLILRGLFSIGRSCANAPLDIG
jgi:hypothetical protein